MEVTETETAPQEDVEEKKKKPGYIQPHAMNELWLHTGTVCNLQCAFCFEASGPGDSRLERLTLDDARPLIDEALSLGVERFSFTGGEPFLVRDFPKILDYALDRRPCLVLTNGTDPLLHLLPKMETFLKKPHPLSFRVSIDHPDEEEHDRGRGRGSFRKAFECMRGLDEMGFRVSVARQYRKGEETEKIEKEFRRLFRVHGLSADMNLVSFPDLLKPGSQPEVPKISEDCMTRYHSEESRRKFMCAYCKMAVKSDGEMRIYPCALVDDDASYDLGASLSESMDRRILLEHQRCFGCFSSGVSCSEGAEQE
jgi:sulfatase maturation enzyme AslB (radical SAM superfamily)